jgi:hypothetical protein
VQAYDARKFAAAVLALGPIAEAALAAVKRHSGLGVRDEADLRPVADFHARLDPPPADIVTEIAGLDLADLEGALTARSDFLAARAEVDAMHFLRDGDPGGLQVAVTHLGNGASAAFLDQVPAHAYAAATYAIARATELADLRGIRGCSLRHGSILSRVGASGKPGAVHNAAL